MMVRASMCVLHNVSMHGWAKSNRATNHNSPLPSPTSNHYPLPCVHHHPKKTCIIPCPSGNSPNNNGMVPPRVCLWHAERKESRSKRSQLKLTKKAIRQQRQECTFCLLCLMPSRLVVALNCFSGVSGVPIARTSSNKAWQSCGILNQEE